MAPPASTKASDANTLRATFPVRASRISPALVPFSALPRSASWGEVVRRFSTTGAGASAGLVLADWQTCGDAARSNVVTAAASSAGEARAAPLDDRQTRPA